MRTHWFWLALFCAAAGGNAQDLFIRISQLGYNTHDEKLGIAFSHAALPKKFRVLDFETRKTVLEQSAKKITGSRWGAFTKHAELDFTALDREGMYVLEMGNTQSLPFRIGRAAFQELPDRLLEFMRQQRCGDNPWLNAECHQQDGRSAYGPLPPGTAIDAVGGWHDAADLLKYQLTSGNATAQLLLAFELGKDARPGVFGNRVNAQGKPGADDFVDVLNEARWGLEWLLKLHPAPDQLYHQVADDRDHAGLRLPQNENVDYGWGKGGARVVYFADGAPQGLRLYKSESTGVANLAGRYAAAMGLAWQIWQNDPAQRPFAERCLKAGKEVYALGKAKEGVQQGNSYGSPYRYEEKTWADDMEWGAAELYRATHDQQYADDALRYATVAESESWMGRTQTRHYEFYPFMNVGHFRLHGIVQGRARELLELYYLQGLERCRRAADHNPYGVGVPFIWCSNNLIAALVTQCLMYERMTGDHRFDAFATRQRDWLAGRNPWGYVMFTWLGEVHPKQPHLMTTRLTGREAPGGLVDGPVYEHIFNSLKGVSITQPDRLAAFQGPAVYHDDFQDYSSNEPTMDGTASAILMWVLCATR